MALIGIWLLCGVAAAVVASNRGGNWLLWLFVGLFLGPIGWALAFAVKKKPGLPLLEFCQHCGSKLSDDFINCPQCLKNPRKLEGPPRKCPMCAEWVRSDAKKCRYCGEQLAP